MFYQSAKYKSTKSHFASMQPPNISPHASSNLPNSPPQLSQVNLYQPPKQPKSLQLLKLTWCLKKLKISSLSPHHHYTILPKPFQLLKPTCPKIPKPTKTANTSTSCYLSCSSKYSEGPFSSLDLTQTSKGLRAFIKLNAVRICNTAIGSLFAYEAKILETSTEPQDEGFGSDEGWLIPGY